MHWTTKTMMAVALAMAPMTALADGYPARDLLSTGKTIAEETIAYPTTGPARVTASIVTIAPGTSTIVHKHGAPLFAYILEGEVTVDYGAAGKHTFKKGDAFMEAMTVMHKGMNLGTVPVSILAVYMGAEGTNNVIAEK